MWIILTKDKILKSNMPKNWQGSMFVVINGNDSLKLYDYYLRI